MKICNKCNETKELTLFDKDPRNKDGFQGICSACRKIAKQKSRAARMIGIGLTKVSEKICNKCSMLKPIAEFYKDAGISDGHSTLCKPCRNQSMSKWRANNRDTYNANMRDWRANNKEEVKDHDLQRTYGIGLEDYKKMLESQNHVCAMCKKPPNGIRPLVVDHNHMTGKIRELLCYGCNRALHTIEDDILYVQALEYLEKHKS